MSATTTDPRAARRERVRHLDATGASTRAIARELNISKDTVRRDLEHLAQTADQQPEPLGDRVARRNEEAGAALRHLAATVLLVQNEKLPYLIQTPEVAHSIEDELRQHAATLTAIANDFSLYYPRQRPAP
ncbi:hypothetical protein GCM10010363_07830 [Streptomyces omiyaensis]|uniref:DeoR family transcriptional regulator n=1 Tax=Streptomyces omiyaensis TaxID=68247 RepID=UPI0016784C3F|nr:DeoR family transcriptional regulator [Streptomyces omiyaensis]GGY29793.1 hypothetical protein GCM10010363_07830 [Streptomyces omiyaensis]